MNTNFAPTQPSAALGLASTDVLYHALKTALPFFPTIRWVESTGSTNSDLLDLARTATQSRIRPWLLGAHLQHQGRGRSGRVWQNRDGAHLMFSCAFDVFLPARYLATLSPLAGVVVTEALRELLPLHSRPKLSMKWPNDILWQQAKLAGILTEVTRASTSPLSRDHHVIIIGIGINLNDARALSGQLDRPIADWAEIVEDNPSIKHVTATDIVACIANAWYQTLNEVTAYGFQDLPKRYQKVDGLYDKPLTIIDNKKTILAGIGAGVNEHGQLLVRSGSEYHAISVGEVSVRPTPKAST